MKLWVGDLDTLVDLAVDALFSGLLGSDGFEVVGFIQRLSEEVRDTHAIQQMNPSA